MGIRESLLNTITSVSNGDFIRIVTAAGASSKATLANVMKSFETGLGSKSSLTTSDYIRVVGSDNVCYKQLISALMEVMGTLTYKRTLTSSDDCNTLEQGVYTFNTSVPQNAPSGVSYGTLIVVNGTYGSASLYNFQLLSVSGKGLYYRRKQGNSDDSFADWARVSRADELDALKNPAKTVSNIDTATATGFYGYTSAASGTKPIADSGGDLIVIAHSSTYSVQVAIPYSTTNANNIYKRVIVSGTPTEWKLQPTRTEVDTLNNKRAFQGWGTSLTFTLTNGRQALVFVNNNEIYLVWNPTSSALNVAQVFSRSGQATATIARGDSNTEIVVTTTSSSSITALVVS